MTKPEMKTNEGKKRNVGLGAISKTDPNEEGYYCHLKKFRRMILPEKVWPLENFKNQKRGERRRITQTDK
jgi:hypothetical protein